MLCPWLPQNDAVCMSNPLGNLRNCTDTHLYPLATPAQSAMASGETGKIGRLTRASSRVSRSKSVHEHQPAEEAMSPQRQQMSLPPRLAHSEKTGLMLPRFTDPAVLVQIGLRVKMQREREERKQRRQQLAAQAAPQDAANEEAVSIQSVGGSEPISTEQWEELRRKYHKRLLDIALVMAADLGFSEADALNCVQQAFLERKLYTLEPVREEFGFLVKRMNARLRDCNRKRRDERERFRAQVAEAASATEDPEDAGPQPDAFAAAAELEQAIASALLDYVEAVKARAKRANKEPSPLAFAVIDWMFHNTDPNIKVAHLGPWFGKKPSAPDHHLRQILKHIRARLPSEYQELLPPEKNSA